MALLSDYVIGWISRVKALFKYLSILITPVGEPVFLSPSVFFLIYYLLFTIFYVVFIIIFV